MKQCSQCGLSKASTDFYKNRHGRDGLQPECKKCNNIRRRKHALAKPNEQRSHRLKSRYGISLAQYNELLERQGGVCAICRKPETQTWKGKLWTLSVDHNHESDRVRGLLCHRCNTSIGLMEEDMSRLVNAINYLWSYEDEATC